MAKFITKTKIKEIFKEHKRNDIAPETETWVEQLLTDIILQIQEEQEIKEEKLATKDDLKLLIEKFDARFESMQKEMNTRFEALQKEMNARFEVVNARFESLEKRFTHLTWMMGIGFTMIAILMGLMNLLKH
ncbi:MAG: hypothetical protein KatS3mg035_1233 [Bacteroidia bacterium]|nr:MAG: hypothetical protein KatS3mg035_1233 [Bacteroidia bacterium]